jgi:hypothetical protein
MNTLFKRVLSRNESICLEDPPMTFEMTKTANVKESTFNVIRVSVTYPEESVIEVETVELTRDLPGMGFYITGDFTIEELEVWSDSSF